MTLRDDPIKSKKSNSLKVPLLGNNINDIISLLQRKFFDFSKNIDIIKIFYNNMSTLTKQQYEGQIEGVSSINLDWIKLKRFQVTSPKCK